MPRILDEHEAQVEALIDNLYWGEPDYQIKMNWRSEHPYDHDELKYLLDYCPQGDECEECHRKISTIPR